jgi:hypothetical protein
MARRKRFGVLAAITCGWLALPPVAQAGDIACGRILAVSTDGRLVAEAGNNNSEPGVECYLARLSKVGTQEILARADCPLKEDNNAFFPCDLAPALDKWKWKGTGNPAKGLVTIDPASAAELARLCYDDNTDVLFLEVKHKGEWLRIQAMEETQDNFSIAGAVSSAATLVVVLNTRGSQGISSGDYPLVFPVAEIDDVDGRWKRARVSAEKSTAHIYQQRRQHAGIFADPPKNQDPLLWGMRTRHGIARVLRKWQIADGYRPLPTDEIRRALGLVALLEANQRKHQALLWFLRTKQKDPAEAEALLTQLRASAETRALASYLAATEDPLWGLPSVETKLAADDLTKLSTTQLTWLHRSVYAQLGVRFDDPQVQSYFEQLRWYKPIGKRYWREVATDARWQRDPDEYFLTARCGPPEHWSPLCLNLQLLHKLLAARSK